jgi:hypothetical protein
MGEVEMDPDGTLSEVIFRETLSTSHLRSTAYVAGPNEEMKFSTLPRYVLTPWKADTYHDARYVCTVERLCYLVGVPDLPGRGIFAYGTDSTEVCSMVGYWTGQGLLITVPVALKVFILENIVVF